MKATPFLQVITRQCSALLLQAENRELEGKKPGAPTHHQHYVTNNAPIILGDCVTCLKLAESFIIGYVLVRTSDAFNLKDA
jgi:hypothetical protein